MNFRNAGPSRPPHPPPACPRSRPPSPPLATPIPPQTLPVCDFGGHNRPRATQQHPHPVENLEPCSGVLLTSPAFCLPPPSAVAPGPPPSFSSRDRRLPARAATEHAKVGKGNQVCSQANGALCATDAAPSPPPSATPASVSDPARPAPPLPPRFRSFLALVPAPTDQPPKSASPRMPSSRLARGVPC